MTVLAADQLRLSDFDYDLPESLIAQEPCNPRDRSRLMVLRRGEPGIEHRTFRDIKNYLVPGDLLVLNNTKVFPCRLPAKKPGGGRAEIFLLSEQGPNLWHALVRGKAAPGRKLRVTAGIEAELLNDGGDGTWSVRFDGIGDIRDILPRIGKTPLPPYIKREPSATDRERYQTVYAAFEGAVAAPTAGLHFTPELLEDLRAYGVEFAFVTLHVGPGTFQPVRTDLVTDHRMPPERYEIPAAAAEAVNRAKSEGRRVVAVGTTSVRAIETAATDAGTVISGEGSSRLFIYPGYRFKATDAILTNFHLPKSTLLMLVSAFEGRDRVISAYRTAAAEKYRFYSYGDAMLII
jgi:S-adenosylmethionine:tRNA ribosyltransferase-isomerase